MQLERAAEFMPGGNTRSVLFYPPYPLTMAKGDGCYLWDVDGHRYADFLGEFTAGIYGHSDPNIRAALEEALSNGINLSAHNVLESQLAEILCERLPSLESVRFTNSGTEANLMAIALAKVATRRPKILVFEGAYHGSAISFLGGSSQINVPHEFIIAPYNDPDAARDLIALHGRDLAAVLVEPMLGAGGCIPGDEEFLKALREKTEEMGVLLIFDEVMTSRLSYGGRQEQLGILPDLTVIGKYFGGGLSFGAFGGKKELMQAFDPRRPDCLSHPGTFNNNVLTMAAGIAGLTHLYTRQAASDLNAKGERLRRQVNDLFHQHRAPLHFTGLGSVMNVHPAKEPINRPGDVAGRDRRLRELYFFDLLSDGIYIAYRGLVALTLPIDEIELAQFLRATERFLARRGHLFTSAQK
jgi:glutamate-1-semialdehyde 2,1-aminomutase